MFVNELEINCDYDSYLTKSAMSGRPGLDVKSTAQTSSSALCLINRRCVPLIGEKRSTVLQWP